MNAIAMTLPADTHAMQSALNTPIGVLCDPSQTAVPLKPSAAMLAAGSRAGGVSVEVAWKIYQAMIHHAE